MQYRELGRTGLRVSALGLGCVQIGSSNQDYAARLVRRALELGVTYFDVARGYWEAEIHLGSGLAGQRDKAIISTKTAARTGEDAWREINESLERLGTDTMYDHYRTMGPQAFRAFPWSRSRVERDLAEREGYLAAIRSCTRCGECEARCPYGLPVMEMLQGMLPAMEDMVAIYRQWLRAG